MTPKEKAIELVRKYSFFVNGYIGSSFLTGTEYPEQILSEAKKASIVAVDEILKVFDGMPKPEYSSFDSIGERKFTFYSEYSDRMTGYDMIMYWEEVKNQINALTEIQP